MSEQAGSSTLTAEKAALERAERERAPHKKAARAFFDALNELYPPVDTDEYWEKVADRIKAVYMDAGAPMLLKHLLVGIMEYFEEYLKGGEDDAQSIL